MGFKRLVLFDIDGTIILTKGAGRYVLERAIDTEYGSSLDASQIGFSGKTDPQIVREILEFNGIKGDYMRELRGRILIRYADEFNNDDLLPTLEVLPGIIELVGLLSSEPGIQLGLLTGNLEKTSWLKVQAAGLDKEHFDLGGYGSDHEDRYSIPGIVLDKANRFYEHEVRGDHLLIIGDTEHDIKCGRSIGAKSIGVATGYYSFEDLQSHDPDLVYHDLGNHESVAQDILSLA